MMGGVTRNGRYKLWDERQEMGKKLIMGGVTGDGRNKRWEQWQICTLRNNIGKNVWRFEKQTVGGIYEDLRNKRREE
jgi:hypothetical protein